MRSPCLGQRVGPTVNVTSDDPLAAIFEQLETQLVGQDPYTILTKLANNFYNPDRNWFIAADLDLRGFQVRILFNDPSIYGLEISVPASPITPFAGLLFEILYQKLSPNLGVYYGALTLPYALRRIVLEGVILILPGFSIWVYTNGDFRVNIGWPMGNASIGIQVGVLVGAAGLYFAKLRSGDNPGVPTTVDYNPILQFGLGVSLYVHQSFNASIFSATIDVTLSGTFQGLLAWEDGEGSMSGPPDHYWFAATVGLSVLIQGIVDFSVIKASVLIQFTANAGVAFETGCQTLITVSAEVKVEVRVKIVFFTVGLSFHTSINKTWQVGSGSQVASLNGPVGMTAPSLAESQLRTQALAAVHNSLARLTASQAARTPFARLAAAARAAAAAPVNIDVQFVLQPTAVYGGSGSAFNIIASLLLEAPAGNGSPVSPGAATPFQQLFTALLNWLLALQPSGTLEEQLQAVVNALGQGSDAPFGDYNTFTEQVTAFLLNGCTFIIHQVDLASPTTEQAVTMLPMIPALRMNYTDQNGNAQTVDFDAYNPIPDNYAQAVNFYFQDIGFGGSAPEAKARRISVKGANASPPSTSMATYVWSDYFALGLRNLAGGLLKLAQEAQSSSTEQFFRDVQRAHDTGQVWDVVDLVSRQAARVASDESLQQLLDQFDWVSAAGLGSRFLLAGLQLPEPGQIPANPTPQNMAAVPTGGLYTLTGQQFAIAVGNTTAAATLLVNPEASVPANWIVFDSGSPDQATAEFALPASVPPEPTPTWIDGSPGQATSNSLVVTALPPVSSQPLHVALKSQIAWSDQGQAQTLFPLPSAILTAAANGGALITITDTPPPSNNTPASAAGKSDPATPALVIPLSLAQVPLHPQGTLVAADNAGAKTGVGSGGSPSGPVSAQYLPFVYQLNGTDEATRDLIFAALQTDLSKASVRLLYPSGSGSPNPAAGLQSDDLASDVLIAKTNLSTLNQLPQVGVQFVRMGAALGTGDTVFAPISDAAAFLQLIWEVSVVNAAGFFLFYVTTDGKGLPTSLFSDPGTEGGMTAQFTVVVELAQTAQTPTVVDKFTNAVFIAGAVDPAKDVLFAAVSTAGAKPVMQYSSTYAAGNVGCVLTWDRADGSPDTPVPVAELYHLVQFQVQASGVYSESVWSLPAGPAQNNAPARSGGSPGNLWTYAATIPAYVYKAGSPNGNIYSAMGDPIEIALRIIDVYGNALPDTHLTTQTPLYQDPLVPLGAWPGVQFCYSIQAAGNNSASLVFSGHFDPASITPPDSPASPDAAVSIQQQWVAVAQRYRVIVDQLTDPNTQCTLATTLTGGILANSSAVAANLLSFAQTILEEVAAAAASSPPPPPQPQSFATSAAVPFSAIVALTADIVPIVVTATLARTNQALIDPTALANLPGAASVTTQIAAQFASGGSPQSPGTASPLSAFAIELENAFTNYDGVGGMLKLAQRAGVQTGSDPSQVQSLWAVRWSTTSGIRVAFPGEPVYFGLKPMSQTLLSLQNSDSATAGADLDLLAQQFVNAFEEFFTPTMAVAIAILDVRNGTSPSQYEAITTTKTQLANTIPLGLANIFASQHGAGNLSDAQKRLTQALLTSLSNAFDVTTVVQVPASVQATGAASPGVTQPPMLFGALGPVASGSPGSDPSPGTQKPYTLSAGELNIETGQPWMTSLLTVAQPGKQEAIYLPLVYDITYLQHDFTDSDTAGAGAYTASSWLKFLRPGDLPLRIPVTGQAGIPIPLIFAPTPPSLVSQSASAAPFASPVSPSIQAEISAALRWDYQLAIAPNWSAQDDLFFSVTYNVGSGTDALRAMYGVDPRVALLRALDDFLTWYRQNLSLFPAIATEAYPSSKAMQVRKFATAQKLSPNDPAQLIGEFADKANTVAKAWAALYLPKLFLAAFEPQIIDQFQFLRDSTSPQTVLIYAMSSASGDSNPEYWPTVAIYNDASGGTESWTPDPSQAQPASSPDEGWWVLSHTFSLGEIDRVVFTFAEIDLQHRQSATASAYIQRNAELVTGEMTNPDFVLQTEVVSFPTSVIPLVHRATIPTVEPDKAGLQQTLVDILTPLANPAAQWTSTLRITASFAWQLTAPSNGGPGLLASDAILLADNVDFQTQSIAEVTQQLAQEIGNWYWKLPRSSKGALLNLAVTVFALVDGEQMPLIQFDQIPIDVSGVPIGWWPPTTSPASP